MEKVGQIKRRRTLTSKSKSRTIRRPAFGVIEYVEHHVFAKIILGVLYTIAILTLFALISVQFVQGYSLGGPVPETSSLVAPPPVARPAVAKPNIALGLPVRLKIPSIRVNALIRSVGLAANGSMGVPKKPADAAWYMLGPKPGELGSAVIAGHVNWLYGATGVFAHLSSLKPGDKISVQDDKGVIQTFVVRESRALGVNDDASDVFLSYDGKAHLNLVTCSGVWDKKARLYSKRLVVFTDKVD